MKILPVFLTLLVSILSTNVQSGEANSLTKLNQLIAQHQGKVIYVDFWASWCVPCRQSFPWLNQMQSTYGPDGLVVIAVNLDEEPEMAATFLRKWPASFTVTYDPKGLIASHYQLKGMPSSFMINRQGEIAASHVGFFANKTNNYEQEIKTLLNQPAVLTGVNNES